MYRMEQKIEIPQKISKKDPNYYRGLYDLLKINKKKS
jgi:hypothetical protein